MRATGQAKSLTGALGEDERRLVLARALLGEWLGGSGGGWQDSGGVWPGMKFIKACCASEGDPEFGISRGRLMPTHRILDHDDVSRRNPRNACRRAWCSSTAAWPRMSGRSWKWSPKNICSVRAAEWTGAPAGHGMLDGILSALARAGRARRRRTTTRNFFEPIQTIIPWASNALHRDAHTQAREEFGEGFLGVLDAGRHVRRRDGLHFRARSEGRGAKALAGDHVRRPSASCNTPCRSRWNLSFMISRSTSAAPWPSC